MNGLEARYADIPEAPKLTPCPFCTSAFRSKTLLYLHVGQNHKKVGSRFVIDEETVNGGSYLTFEEVRRFVQKKMRRELLELGAGPRTIKWKLSRQLDFNDKETGNIVLEGRGVV